MLAVLDYNGCFTGSIRKLQIENFMNYIQTTLAADFGYSDEVVMRSLEECLRRLRVSNNNNDNNNYYYIFRFLIISEFFQFFCSVLFSGCLGWFVVLLKKLNFSYCQKLFAFRSNALNYRDLYWDLLNFICITSKKFLFKRFLE